MSCPAGSAPCRPPPWQPPSGTGSMSGCTILILPLKLAGFPKKMNSLPGFIFSDTHLSPLKNTSSISPLPSDTIALSRLPPGSSTFTTRARICTYAISGRICAIGVMLLLSMYRNGYSLMRSPNVSTPSSLRRSAARFGPTPGRYCISLSSPSLCPPDRLPMIPCLSRRTVPHSPVFCKNT